MAALVTANGLASIVEAFVEFGGVHLQFGTGAGQGIAATNLAASVDQTRVAVVPTQETTTFAGDTYRTAATITALTPLTITEVGVFSAGSGDNLMIYADFPSVGLNTGDAIEFQIDMVLG